MTYTNAERNEADNYSDLKSEKEYSQCRGGPFTLDRRNSLLSKGSAVCSIG